MEKEIETPESEDFEFKSLFSGESKEWLGIIKTIVAMANTKGGIIKVDKLNKINPREFDTARIDDKVNSFISPRIHNILTKSKENSIIINIPNSGNKPHLFHKDGTYQDTAQRYPNFEFHQGQVWVRHSGKNERATKDDFDRMFKEKLDEFLKSITVIANQFPVSTKELRVVEELDNKEAIPIQIRESGEGLPVLLKKEKADPNIDFPYNARELGRILGKSQNFIARTTIKLGLRNDMKYAIQIKNPQGKVIMIKYGIETLHLLKKLFTDNSNFNPYR